MRKLLFNFLILPLGPYILIFFILAILIGPTSWLSAYTVGYPIAMFIWWGVSFSRWLHDKYNWETLPYIVANFFLSLGFLGIGYLLALGFAVGIGIQNTIAFILFMGGGLACITWFLRSLFELIFHRLEIYNSVHWLPLEADWFIFRSSAKFKAKNSSSVDNSKNKSMKSKPKPTKKEDGKSIFRSIGSITGSQSEYGAIPIPPRREGVNIPKQKQVLRSHSSPNVQIRISSPSGSFVSEAKRYVNRTETNAIHVPFMQYWPTYDGMSPQQQRWYFYWRGQVRSGNFLSTDTSYIFVYVYELINLVGFNTPQAAFEQLVRLYKNYRGIQPKLDNYLPDWIADFIVVHQLPIGVMKWYQLLGGMGVSGDEDLSIEAWLLSGANWESLPLQTIYRIADYNPTKTKFYKQEGSRLKLDSAYLTGIQAVDEYLRNTKQKSLFELYQTSRTRLISRPPFASAVHDYPSKHIDIASVHTWMGNETLANAVKNILRYTENVVRENDGYKYKLRDIQLSTDWEKAIESAFKVAKPKQEIQIDSAALEQLKQESDAIRKRLIVSNEDSFEDSTEKLNLATNRLSLGTENDSLETADIPVPSLLQDAQELPKTEVAKTVQELDIDLDRLEALKEESEKLRERLILDSDEQAVSILSTSKESEIETASPSYMQRPAAADDNLLTDLVPIASILGKVDSDAATLARLMRENSWTCSLKQIQAHFEGKFANVIIDNINEQAYELFSDALLFEHNGNWSLNEEYQDEIEYILTHPEYQLLANEVYTDLAPEWAAFASHLQNHHWESLVALLSQEDVENRLNAIAKPVHKTGNLIVDEINETAQETLGDILVETTGSLSILEDEQDAILNLVNWAATNHIIEV